ncbi:MAG: fasciclin domain-containing protein [Pelagimonas sp.]|jgi:uncharacterized surface protein with fasciclin (FAS1) repeats|nr:fasciclin domain-containing protein [Pelagimonas sp.]
MTRLKLTCAAIAVSLAGAAHANTIVDIAAGDERFSTLVAALQAADLVETLQGPGPFTVFAPLNDAFAALPEGTVEGLLQPEAKDQLTNVLLYHVDDAKIMSGDLPSGMVEVQPVMAANSLCVDASDGVQIADGTGQKASVVIADIVAENGVIHVIDKVLLPGTSPMCK